MAGWGGLPGKKGVDYHFVRGPHGQIYAVYRVKLPNGTYVNTTWKIQSNQYKALGINPDKIRKVSSRAVRNLNIFGDASEIVRRGADDKHPFQSHVESLQEEHKGLSWLGNKEFMATMLMGWAEGWDSARLQNMLTHTQWYQSRTEAQRDWEINTSKEQREAELKSMSTRVTEALQGLYGTIGLKEAGVDQEQINTWAKRIASGALGDPSDGFEMWLERQRRKAEKVEGSAAWITRQQEIEEQRAFMNRPEDVREQIRQEAFQWLGPRGVPDDETLTRWSEQLVSETRSDGDWQTFLRNQAKNLYPWLGTDESWQDRASMYKRIAEEQFGSPIEWEDDLLVNLGERDTAGGFTGNSLSFDDYTQQLRSTDRWWGTNMAQEETSQLGNYLNNIFRGVG